jgi:hypothetical protein
MRQVSSFGTRGRPSSIQELTSMRVPLMNSFGFLGIGTCVPYFDNCYSGFLLSLEKRWMDQKVKKFLKFQDKCSMEEQYRINILYERFYYCPEDEEF